MFYDCPLKSVFIGRPLNYDTRQNYGYSPFARNDSIVKARFGNPVTSIQSYLFYGCPEFTTLEYNSKCAPTSIGDWTFSGCKSLVDGTSIIPTSVKTIGSRAFYNCAKLENITIPRNVTSIGDYGFAECPKLMNIVCMALTPPSINTNCFSTDTYNNATLDVGNVIAYSKATGWKEFLKYISVVPVSDAVSDSPKITATNGRINVNGGKNVVVYNMSGSPVGSGHEVNVPSGIYIVVVDGKSQKVMVR